jgi:uncharacterized protein (DUF849 family)
MVEKNIINFVPTGMVPTKTDTPHVPVSSNEIIEQVHQVYELGITIAHLHVRDESQVPTWKKTSYFEVFEGIKKYCPELIICGSTSGRNFPDFEKRTEVLELKPDMASLTLSSVNFINSTGINEPNIIVEILKKMNTYNILPELEVFDLGAINYGKYLIKKGLIKSPTYWNIMLGNINGLQTNLAHISSALNDLPDNSIASLGGIGVENQLKANSIAISLNMGVRVGIEDNIWFDINKTKKATNFELVKRIHDLLNIHGREYMKSNELRKKFNI